MNKILRTKLLNDLRDTLNTTNIHLPTQLTFNGDYNHLEINMSGLDVVEIMYENNASVDALMLAFKFWLGIKTITLKWEKPGHLGHQNYLKFLFRITYFAFLFPWCKLANPEFLANGLSFTDPYYLHWPPSEEKLSKFILRPPTTLEVHLHKDPKKSKLMQAFVLDILEPRVPCGLISTDTPKSEQDIIFHNQSTTFDYLGIDAEQRCYAMVFRPESNSKLGIISETLFYGLMAKHIHDRNFILPSSHTIKNYIHIDIDAITNTHSIYCVAMAVTFHPCLAEGRLFNELNKAMAEKGVPISFEQAQIQGSIENDDIKILRKANFPVIKKRF